MTDSVCPAQPLGLNPSFGFGDRIGSATPGHIAAIFKAGQGIAPIFAQQSIREMTRTSRSPEQVMDDALRAMQDSHWNRPHGADADHLKTREDVDSTAAAGFTFFTIDPSDHVDQKADNYDETTIRERFETIRDKALWTSTYIGKSVVLANSTKIDFNELAVLRAAVKYGLALNEALALANYIDTIQTQAGRSYEVELSVDETEQPTTLVEHYIIAEQSLQQGMRLVSLAPRFVGNFEKGVDFIGDLCTLSRSLKDHAAIVEQIGPYKLSLHSGSDKISMYGAFARATKGRFHVKTAGTSYLEALRVVAIHEPEMFREICEFSYKHYDTDRSTYHVHATLNEVPAPAELSNSQQLEDVYLERWENVPNCKGFTEAGRQILHCTFGSVLTDDRLGTLLRKCLADNQDTYTQVLTEHFSRHLEALQTGC